ncbi:MAG: multiheme c-type cytochrome [Candidatus Eisenbacteria bacterium]
MDSVRAQYSQVLVVDAGGFFPEQNDAIYQNPAWFMLQAMKLLGTDASGMSDKELRFGKGFLVANARSSGLQLVCANLWDKQTKKTLVAPSIIKKVGTVKVGIFGLTSDKVDMGPARDSVTVEEPTAAARRTIASLRKQGATVIVLLSQLGKVESEDLVTAVDGIDVVVVGRNVPLLQKGRMIKNTVACYGGEQGQYIGRTIVTLDAARKMATGENDTYILGPEVGEKPEILTLVKSFEDAFNEKLRQEEKKKAAAQSANPEAGEAEASVDHYMGAEVCGRCHQAEMAQYKTTSHARAWETLVEAKKDANPECITCHVVGYKQAGGFKTGDDATRLADVQCENCHGMGTQHEAFPTAARRITEATCVTCHNPSNSPTFSFAVYQPHILHKVPANMPPLPVNPNKKMMGTGGH